MITSALGVREAKRVWPDDLPHCVVSIGSGKLPWQYRAIEAKPTSLLDTMNHVSKIVVTWYDTKSFCYCWITGACRKLCVKSVILLPAICDIYHFMFTLIRVVILVCSSKVLFVFQFCLPCVIM